MKKRFSLSIRTQLIILIFVMSLAPLGITIFSALQKHNSDKQEAWLTAERLCNEVGNQQNVLLSGTEQLLSSLAYVPSIQHRDAKAVTTLFAQLADKYPHITNILIADSTGRVWASAHPMRGSIFANDRRFFRNVLATGNFSAGEFTIGRVLNKPVLSFGYPIRDSLGKIRDIAIVAFTLDSYNQLLKMKKMPDNTSLVLTDHNGTILFDAGDSRFIGMADKEDIFKQLSEGPDKGNLEATGITGKHRYFAYQKLRLGNEQTPYMYVRTGILKESIVSDTLILNVGIMGLFTLLAICFAVYTSKRGIVDKIIALRDAAHQVGNGNLMVQVSDSVFGGEFGELGRAFDEMSHRLADDLSKREQFVESLRESEAKYRMLVETANEGVLVLDKERCTTFVNAQIAEILGYSPAEMLGREIVSFIAPEETGNHAEQMTLLQLGKSSRFERLFQHKDGSLICLLVSAAPLLDSQGCYCGSFAMLNDISKRKQMEEELYKSKLLLEKTFESLNEAIFIVETGTRIIIDCNITCERMFGYTKAEMIGVTTEFLHISKEMSQRFGSNMQQAYAAKGFFETVSIMKRRDGTVFDSEHLVTPIRNELGEIIKHVCVVRDISVRVGLENELATLVQEVESRTRFVESVFTNLQSGIIVVDLDLRIKMVNCYVAKLCGVAEEQFVGRALADLSPELNENVVAGKAVDELLINFCHIKINIGYSISDLTDAEGNIVDYIIHFKDLTEVVRIRRDLRQKERLSAMGEVVARVAHEMRNPLFGMTAAAQILEMELTLEPSQQELMNSLLKESRRLNNLVEELLATTRETRISKKRVNLVQVVEVSLKTVETILTKKMVTLCKSYGEEVWLSADFEKLEQVVINLVKNASEASRAGGYITVEVEPAGSHVEVIITDNGQGILSEDLEKIFDVFYTTKKNGTGMGLSICRSIVEAHGGSLTAANNPDGGAKFVMQLPFGECQV